MSFVESLKKATSTQVAQGPVQQQRPGPSPVTKEELNKLREQDALRQQEELFHRQRTEALGASIFTRLVGESGLVDQVCEFDPDKGIQINEPLFYQFIHLLNYISAEAAIAHAREVWGIDIRRKSAQPETAAAPQQ